MNDDHFELDEHSPEGGFIAVLFVLAVVGVLGGGAIAGLGLLLKASTACLPG